ncbi:hypothetical protein TSUD_89900 [Trifolium subterraneum]|uniref:Uncharacterized protein n=1 Tax=Trifolium subterraneum TaxID=3900 RepID=A0A2Z6NMW2_TRISU|nr:hypothetical protein TSUD_89900 [Trifolium subterraneum]
MAFNPFLLHHAAFLKTETAKPTCEDQGSAVDDFLIAMQTYQMEFDDENVRVKKFFTLQ